MRLLKSANVKRVIATASASAVAVVGTMLISAAPAEAACQGDNAHTITHYENGVAVAQERRVSGTCDGNGVYTGELRDLRPADGYSAKVRYKEGDFNEVVFSTMSSSWQRYTYREKTPDTGTPYASMQVYANAAHRPDIYTPNYGF
ncbi:hypothetical protein [Glycomyces tritici]|uniref:Secreted protein n=1 Tax=Glycomyces tritici TaxID=2665176 RepID=A0ABT7YKF0_9ACTN|nr:hypothetical protein [Glycomyces tritici]MDN3239110.1 hypothetical protein [Glycomyces tritici]MDN3240272.1 hypothetical protein [Glycomyces tritici]